MSKSKPTPEQLSQLRLHVAYLEEWLSRNRVTWAQLAKAEPCWETSAGRIPITIEDVEVLIGIEDPVAWAWMNLVEKESVFLDGIEVVKAGQPWGLFPIQGQLARIWADSLVECGSEVGKTRDIVLKVLWRADTRRGPGSAMVGGDSDQTLIPIWEEIEFQLEKNPGIGGGLVEEKCHIKPNRKKVFRSGYEVELRLTGFDGRNFRGGHFSDAIFADEAALWKSRKQWSEFWRAGKPGSVAFIYSTPDGDYSSPFCSMSLRARPINGAKVAELSEEEKKKLAPVNKDERPLLKYHISKKDLPSPWWSRNRELELTDRYGGQDTVEWITNVEGGWGSPTYSIFPMIALEPCLVAPERYAMVRGGFDRRQQLVTIAAVRLVAALEYEYEEGAGGDLEELLGRDTLRLAEVADDGGRLGPGLAARIAAYFPDISDWVSPKLFWGGDLGSAQDPTELVLVRVIGKRWEDVFRLNLKHVDPTDQADVVAHLDHSSGHRASWSLDNGSWGSTLVSILTSSPLYESCPVCGLPLYLRERAIGRGFGEYLDLVDISTGQPVMNPQDLDAAGNMRPFRVSNKEFGTRILERKIAAGELAIARDSGAGDQRMSGPQLLVNHTATGINKKNERTFRAVDDHHVDARRQVALSIVAAETYSDGFVSPDMRFVASTGAHRVSAFGDAEAVRSGAGLFGVGSLRGGVF